MRDGYLYRMNWLVSFEFWCWILKQKCSTVYNLHSVCCLHSIFLACHSLHYTLGLEVQLQHNSLQSCLLKYINNFVLVLDNWWSFTYDANFRLTSLFYTIETCVFWQKIQWPFEKSRFTFIFFFTCMILEDGMTREKKSKEKCEKAYKRASYVRYFWFNQRMK